MAMTEEVLKVQGMSCNHCKMAVEKAVKNLPGVSAAEVERLLIPAPWIDNMCSHRTESKLKLFFLYKVSEATD